MLDDEMRSSDPAGFSKQDLVSLGVFVRSGRRSSHCRIPSKSCLSTAVRLPLQVTIIKCLRVFSHWQNKVAIDSGKPEKVMYDMVCICGGAGLQI